MHSLSDATRALISELVKPASFFSLNNANKKRKILEQIAELGELAAVPYILPLLLERHLLSSAAKALAKLFTGLSEGEIWNFRELCELRGYVPATAWSKIGPEFVQELDEPESEFIWALGAASVHHNGYVREKAVHLLSNRREPIALAFLIARANDWVFEVRTSARSALIAQTQENPGAFAAFLPLLDRLAACNRDAHGTLVDYIRDALRREPGLMSLQAAIKNTNGKDRRAAFKLALSSDDDAAIDLAKIGIEDSDLVVRVVAARKLIALPRLLEIPQVLRKNRVNSIRLLVIEKAASMVPPELALLKELVLDRSASVRSAARFYLSKLGFNDFASIYRDALVREEAVEAAIMGLGETASSTDFKLICAYLSNTKPRCRAAAVFAFGKLAQVGNDGPLLVALGDEGARVSAAAYAALIQRSSIIPADQLMDMFKATGKEHVQKNIIRIFATFARWTALACLLEATAYATESPRELALLLIRDCLERANRAYAMPPPRAEEVERIRKALEAAHLGSSWTSAIRTLLKI
jgi:HEAT repeat protein